MVARRYSQLGILFGGVSCQMDNNKEKDGLKKTLKFRSVDDEVHVFDVCGKQLGRIVYFEGYYTYILRPSNGVVLTILDMLEITAKMKEMLQ
jgi:hypothetical protein